MWRLSRFWHTPVGRPALYAASVCLEHNTRAACDTEYDSYEPQALPRDSRHTTSAADEPVASWSGLLHSRFWGFAGGIVVIQFRKEGENEVKLPVLWCNYILT